MDVLIKRGGGTGPMKPRQPPGPNIAMEDKKRILSLFLVIKVVAQEVSLLGVCFCKSMETLEAVAERLVKLVG